MKNSNQLPIKKQKEIADRLKTLRTTAGYTQGYIAKKMNITEKTYRKWEVGTYTKDDIKYYPAIDCENLFKLSDLYHVSIDYLLCRSNCTGVENHYISKKTGLSSEAIEQLIEWNEKTKLLNDKFYRKSIFFISDLLECCGNQAAALAQNVSNYLFYRKISETESLTSQITKGVYDKYEVGRTRASYKFLDCLEYIYRNSKNIPTKESLQTAYPKTEEEKYWDDILGV